jgi:FixJ family two-component response regulator
VRWIRDTFFPIRDQHGRVSRAAGIAQDITAHEGALVYLVAGETASRRSMARLFKGAGYDAKLFPSMRAFLEVAPALASGCVLLDVRAPEAGSLAIPLELKARQPSLPVIVVGDSLHEPGLGVRAMKAGAVDYVEMPCEHEVLLRAVATALAGIRAEADQIGAAELARARVGGMPAREREVLQGLLAGGTNKTIARDLGISPRAVEFHRAQLRGRRGARTLPEAVLIAAAAGLQPPRSSDPPG